MNIKKSLSFILILLFFGLPLAACNTMEGLGEDMQQVGEEIEEEADK